MRSSHVLDNFRKGDYEGLGLYVVHSVVSTPFTTLYHDQKNSEKQSN